MALVAPARLPVMHNNLVDEADSGMIVTTAVVVGSVKGALYKGHQNGSVGFRRSLEQDYQSVTKRFFILDNSGSTAKPDGHVLVNSGEKTTSLDSSRWEEIRSMAVEQAEWCLQTGVETEFIILNSPSPQDPQEANYELSPPGSFGSSSSFGLQRMKTGWWTSTTSWMRSWSSHWTSSTTSLGKPRRSMQLATAGSRTLPSYTGYAKLARSTSCLTCWTSGLFCLWRS
eukprot:TRINITY_DN90958_c0_g1_i1.p1 TRINITY_DN90958_c0_g1~~TRINITY_DN90958_c0_g1_i1.p1  ORF type:complete len:228 (+),score=13.57 TRINITY_DN90958_c0_g1_i1:88-771(+)